ncbi:MAG: NPCBM/NEW2 domain-containing protein [Planctomycetota bacterium]
MKPLILAALAVLAAPVLGTAAIVHTVSARCQEGKLVAITPDDRLELARDGESIVIPLEDVFRIQLRQGPVAANTVAAVEVRTVRGSRLYGKLVKSHAALGLASTVFAEPLGLDADELLVVRFNRADEHRLEDERLRQALARTDRQHDELFVATPRGVLPFRVAVERITPGKTFFTWRGENRTVTTEKVSAVVFANPEEADRPPAEVTLIDGSVVRGTLDGLDKGELRLDVGGTKTAIELQRIHAIEVHSPSVVYLSTLRPAQVREVPFFNHVWEHRADRSVSGGPLSLDGRKYARGLGCHTRTILRYDLGGQYRTFAAVVGIDDEARPHGSVEFVVKADGRKLFAKVLTGRDKAVSVAVDISGARRLTLVADFAEDASVGDHADWADARVMK